MAYCTGAQFLERYDARRVSELIRDDGVKLSTGFAAYCISNANLLAALEDASAEIDAAAFVGKRYSKDRLTTLVAVDSGGKLVNTGGFLLLRLVADIAYANLVSRRGLAATETSQLSPNGSKALEMLQLIRSGERIFDTSDGGNADAGLMQTVKLTGTQASNMLNSSFRYFGAIPNNGFVVNGADYNNFGR